MVTKVNYEFDVKVGVTKLDVDLSANAPIETFFSKNRMEPGWTFEQRKKRASEGQQVSLEKVPIANYSLTCNCHQNNTFGFEKAYVFRFKYTAIDLSIDLLKICLFLLDPRSIIVLPCHSTQAVSKSSFY